jgi:CheY-like chemotaxis protein
LQQVFWNLLNNAVKFTPSRGRVEVRTSNNAQGQIVVEVIDTGVGINPAQLETIFEPFEQGERVTSRQFGGLGLGLAISRQFVNMHGGRIAGESAGRGKGATFRVILDPADAHPDREPGPIKAQQRPTRSLRILLVEDHGDTRETLSRLLRYFGHEIAVAASREAAFDQMESGKFDVVLSDIGLPDGTGYDVISQAKRKQAVMGVALTGFGSEDDIRRGKAAGFDFHLTKPVDFHELRTVLDQVGQA